MSGPKKAGSMLRPLWIYTVKKLSGWLCKLVIQALKNTYNRYGTSPGCILHSDRGSQYCSNEYQELLKKHGYDCSMSRKGNCWDNAPMEAFWVKLKYEWLNDFTFKTRVEAIGSIRVR
jgi:putative transposase